MGSSSPGAAKCSPRSRALLHEGLRLSRRHQAWLYGTALALLVTGLFWLCFHHYVKVEGEFGETAHPLETWWLKLHGAAAMVFLLVLGSLVRGHLRTGWRMRLNRPSGATVTAANAWLVVSGWGLYYIGAESWRPAISSSHWIVGLVLPVVLAVHVQLGRRSRRRIATRHP